jgi:hypothetical protein
MERQHHIAGLVLALTLPITAGAADLSWDFVDVRYVGYEEPGADGDGFGIAGSFSVNDEWYALGGYEDLTVDVFGFDAGFTLWRLGMGYHAALNGSVQGFTEVTYETMEVSILGFSADENGYGVRLGLRGMATDSLELTGGLRYVDAGASDTLVSLGAVLNVSDTIALTANYEDGDSSFWGVGARFSF